MLTLYACSGPGAGKLIADNIKMAEQMAWVAAAFTAVSVIFYLLTWRFKGCPLICLGLLALHPAWTVSATMGDCGSLKAGTATFITTAAVVIGIAQIFMVILWWWHKPTANPFGDADETAKNDERESELG